MYEKEFAREIKRIGGQAYIVGGWVRDRLMGRAPSDRDYVLAGVAEDAFTALFPEARRVGSSFPVYLVEIDGEKREVAFARQERKTGTGYKGFASVSDPSVTIEEDLGRRDLTINSMAVSLPGEEIIDLFGGQADISGRTLRAVSDRFTEDPVRALRAARQAAQLEFNIDQPTVALMRACADELENEPKERLFAELEKAIASPRPSVFFRCLREAGLLGITFPVIFSLICRDCAGVCRPAEDAFDHVMSVLDKTALRTARQEVRFAALMCGRGSASLADLRTMDKVMRLPRLWKKCAEIVAREGWRCSGLTKPEEMRDLLSAVSRHPIGFDGFKIIIEADNGFLPLYLTCHEKYGEAARAVRALPLPENLSGSEIGEWRRQMEIAAFAELCAD